jgi:NodT family efflux transporter outer membrane factor (OMF) lipoprotein
MIRTLIVVVASAVFTGCALRPPITHNEVVGQALPKSTHIPPQWKADADPNMVTNDWLKSFNDPRMEAIVAEAIANNLDLRAAAQSVGIAQENVALVGSQLLPHVGVQLGARTLKEKDNPGSFNSTGLYAGVGWEFDLWGKLRAEHEASKAAYQATALDYAYARQSLAALTAKSWYLSIGTRELVALAEQAVDVFTKLLSLVETRRSLGKDSDLDVVDVRARLEDSQSELQAARESYGEARRALEVLLGRYPAAEIEVASAFPSIPPPAGAGVPAALLERRPDLVAAERVVLAAFRQQEAAELALLPDFSISLGGGRAEDQLLSLLRLNPWFAHASVGVSIPIFEGGALHAQVMIATAQQAQAVSQYGEVVLTAFQETEDALANEQLLAARLPFENRAVADRTTAVQIATEQYQAGSRDLLWVAQLQSEQLATQASLIKVESLQAANRIQLYLSLGGSYDSTPATTLP